MAGALIVAAELAKPDFEWLDALRRRHYPPDRNRVEAHLTLFRTLPPSAEDEARRSLGRAAASERRPQAQLAGVMDLDSGVALRVASPALERVRDELAADFRGLQTSQDLGRWTPHVTIQNKVEPRVARALMLELRARLEPRPLQITGLKLVRYLEEGWLPVDVFRFRGVR